METSLLTGIRTVAAKAKLVSIFGYATGRVDGSTQGGAFHQVRFLMIPRIVGECE